MKTKYFVVSLPRSGTTSLSKMARVCGLNPKHAPHSFWENHLTNDVFDFFSDTPIYSPEIVYNLCNDKRFISKFIFIDRDHTEIFLSWKKMGLFNNYNGFYGNKSNFDFISYDQAFGYQRLTEENYKLIFQNHKRDVLDIIKDHRKDLLIYNFNLGWDPFCGFVGSEIPTEDIPHLNINTFFDQY